MRQQLKGALAALLVLTVLGVMAVVVFVKVTGLSSRATPGTIETAVSRQLRAWAVPADYRTRANPVLRNTESIRSGMAHFADHCAACHGNDGSGDMEMGKGMFPPAPDMRKPATQEMTDGELFYIIEHGIRFTGMPAWGTGSIEGEEDSWHLVHFIRHLPSVTAGEIAEMEEMNRRAPAEIRQQLEEERFLRGDEPSGKDTPPSHAH